MVSTIKSNGLKGSIVGIVIALYLVADLMMDRTLFPMLPMVLQQHHMDIVHRYLILLNLVWVWIGGYFWSRKRVEKNSSRYARLASVFFGSALAATVLYSFLSLPLIWTAYRFSSQSSFWIFFHDYGLFVFFAVMIPLFESFKYRRVIP